MKPIRTNQKIAQLGSKIAQLLPSSSEEDVSGKADSKHGKFPKTHLNHWRQRLRRTVAKNGTLSSTYFVRMLVGGRRESFPLRESAEIPAAKKALEIYNSIISVTGGWEVTLAKFKPKAVPKLKNPTVGEFIKEARKVFTGSPHTFEVYATKLRTIVAQITGKEGDKMKNDYVGVVDKETGVRAAAGNKLWRAGVESVNLSRITPDAVAKWISKYIADHSDTVIARQRAQNTIRATLRNAKSLFSKKIISHLKHLNLPNPLPFDNVTPPKGVKKRYKSPIKLEAMYSKARAELWDIKNDGSNHEQFTIFILGLFAGLRRGEIDMLKWENVDFDAAKIHVTSTDTGGLKTEDSEADVNVDDETLQLLKEKKAQAKSPFVIESSAAVTVSSAVRQYRYRCDCHHRKLIQWLRDNGLVSDLKPIHALRKELGSHLYKKYGLAVAADVLRHSNTKTTRDYYAARNHEHTLGPSDLMAKAPTDSKETPKQ